MELVTEKKEENTNSLTATQDVLLTKLGRLGYEASRTLRYNDFRVALRYFRLILGYARIILWLFVVIFSRI